MPGEKPTLKVGVLYDRFGQARKRKIQRAAAMRTTAIE
jgi:hypothetical protein